MFQQSSKRGYEAMILIINQWGTVSKSAPHGSNPKHISLSRGVRFKNYRKVTWIIDARVHEL
jgi:hypothetical protein